MTSKLQELHELVQKQEKESISEWHGRCREYYQEHYGPKEEEFRRRLTEGPQKRKVSYGGSYNEVTVYAAYQKGGPSCLTGTNWNYQLRPEGPSHIDSHEINFYPLDI